MRLTGTMLLAVLMMAGCATWEPIRVSPTAVADAHNPERVRVKQLDGSTVVLETPKMVADTIVGVAGGQPTRIALVSVTELAIRTVTLAGAVGPALLAVIAYVATLTLACKIGGCA